MELNDDLKVRAVAWVEATCADQGVPVKLSDPVALDKVAELLASTSPARRQA
jgi:hypothetical protein